MPLHPSPRMSGSSIAYVSIRHGIAASPMPASIHQHRPSQYGILPSSIGNLSTMPGPCSLPHGGIGHVSI
eukprot:560608-Rhodomonas_salina.10